MIIDVWFDKNTNSWVTQLKDNEDNQLGNADYVHSKKEATGYAETLQREHKEATIKIHKRNGELQKEIKPSYVDTWMNFFNNYKM